jgi:hypothetical protein
MICRAQRPEIGFTAAYSFNYAGVANNVRSNFSETTASSASHTVKGFKVGNKPSAGVSARYRLNDRLFFGANFLFSGFSYYAGGSFRDTSYFPGLGGLITKAGFTIKYRQYIPGLETNCRIVKIGQVFDLFLLAKTNFRIAEIARVSVSGSPGPPVTAHQFAPGGKWKIIPEAVLGLQLLSLGKWKDQFVMHMGIGYSFRSLQRMHFDALIADRTESNFYFKYIEFTPKAHWVQIGATYFLRRKKN